MSSLPPPPHTPAAVRPTSEWVPEVGARAQRALLRAYAKAGDRTGQNALARDAVRAELSIEDPASLGVSHEVASHTDQVLRWLTQQGVLTEAVVAGTYEISADQRWLVLDEARGPNWTTQPSEAPGLPWLQRKFLSELHTLALFGAGTDQPHRALRYAAFLATRTWKGSDVVADALADLDAHQAKVAVSLLAAVGTAVSYQEAVALVRGVLADVC